MNRALRSCKGLRLAWSRRLWGIASVAILAFAWSLAGCGSQSPPPAGTESPTEQPPVAEVPTAKFQLRLNNGLVHADDRKPYVDRTKSESVQWVNETDQGCAVAFMLNGWPFAQPPQLILVPANGKSEVYNVAPGTEKQLYSYRVYMMGKVSASGVFPPGRLTDPQGPPDPPGMDVGP